MMPHLQKRQNQAVQSLSTLTSTLGLSMESTQDGNVYMSRQFFLNTSSSFQAFAFVKTMPAKYRSNSFSQKVHLLPWFLPLSFVIP